MKVLLFGASLLIIQSSFFQTFAFMYVSSLCCSKEALRTFQQKE
nr:MAG TPA: hypothetical protein [Caudoviricetes sp.]